MREQGKVLEHHPGAPLLGGHHDRSAAAHQLTADPDLPGSGRFKTGDGAQQGGLAAAARPQETADLPLGQGKRDVTHYLQAVEGDAKPLDLKRRRHDQGANGRWNG